MLEIDVYMDERYDEKNEKFVPTNPYRVSLEHSLVTLSKWESFWEIPFLTDKDKTPEQTISYVKMMILDDEIPPEVFQRLVENHIPEINAYISKKHTASTVPDVPGSAGNAETKTAELIYYWMIQLGIPVKFEHWHLNRLLMLIRVVNFKNDPKAGKMSQKDRRALNKARQKQYNTKG